MTTMLDFYRQHGISPVSQDTSDLQAHFQRRAFLYRSLGLWPQSIEGKHVLEVGPASGDNARYTAHLNPGLYMFCEPNESAEAELRKVFPKAVVSPVPIELWRGSITYDVVLCEGLLGLCGSDPKALLEHVFRQVKVGGVLVITCIDPISDCAETIRRAMAHRALLEQGKTDADLSEKLNILRPIFTPHLATLKGMTRSVDDWIIDNLLNPASIGPTFSIPEACEQLEGRAEVLGSSPRFLTDWRWYKEGQPGNQWAIDCYWENCHGLYDYREVRDLSMKGHRLMSACEVLRESVAQFETGGKFHPNLAQYLAYMEFDPGWFGRGQQYLSFVRTA